MSGLPVFLGQLERTLAFWERDDEGYGKCSLFLSQQENALFRSVGPGGATELRRNLDGRWLR
eukprot:457307-Pyramimonas_sp.AAC.1